MRAVLNPGRAAGAGTPFQWPASVGYSRQPFASAALAGGFGITAGPNGVALARFGWVDPSSLEVSNVEAAGSLLGFVLPVAGMYNLQRVYPCKGAIILRPGMPAVVSTAGVFRTRFPLGAEAGSQVFTDPATGIAYSSNPGSYVATPFTVTENGGCNARLPISSFIAPFN